MQGTQTRDDFVLFHPTDCLGMIQTCIRIYGQTIGNGNGGVPKLIFGSHWVIPELNNANDLVMILQKNLGVPKP